MLLLLCQNAPPADWALPLLSACIGPPQGSRACLFFRKGSSSGAPEGNLPEEAAAFAMIAGRKRGLHALSFPLLLVLRSRGSRPRGNEPSKARLGMEMTHTSNGNRVHSKAIGSTVFSRPDSSSANPPPVIPVTSCHHPGRAKRKPGPRKTVTMALPEFRIAAARLPG